MIIASPALQKARWQRFIHLRGKRKQEYSLTKLWRSALRRSKTHRERVGKISL